MIVIEYEEKQYQAKKDTTIKRATWSETKVKFKNYNNTHQKLEQNNHINIKNYT